MRLFKSEIDDSIQLVMNQEEYDGLRAFMRSNAIGFGPNRDLTEQFFKAVDKFNKEQN